jgi:hypothetical protein
MKTLLNSFLMTIFVFMALASLVLVVYTFVQLMNSQQYWIAGGLIFLIVWIIIWVNSDDGKI